MTGRLVRQHPGGPLSSSSKLTSPSCTFLSLYSVPSGGRKLSKCFFHSHLLIFTQKKSLNLKKGGGEPFLVTPSRSLRGGLPLPTLSAAGVLKQGNRSCESHGGEVRPQTQTPVVSEVDRARGPKVLTGGEAGRIAMSMAGYSSLSSMLCIYHRLRSVCSGSRKIQFPPWIKSK